MRNRVSAYRSRILGQAAVAAILAATVAGCSESSRFGGSLFTGSTQNQREIIGNDQPMPPAVANSAVTRSDLPPASAGGYGAHPSSASNLPSGNYVWTPDGVQPSGGVQPAPSGGYAPPQVATYTPPPAAPVSQSAGGGHVVASGETLYSIGRRYGVRPADIVAANGLSSETIRVGQQLRLPGAGGSAFAQATPAAQRVSTPAVATAPGPGYLTVPSAPASGTAPSVAPPPAVASVPTAPASTEPRVIAGVPAVPTIPVQPGAGAGATPAAAVAAVDEALDPPSSDGTSFRWPVRGRIISGFGTKPNGERNEGINLAVPEGTAIKAAEAGTVIYAGNELEGYGKLVLVRHKDDWVTAYAHNSNLSVKKGDTVRRGQTIASAGMTGSVTSPQLHFEIRRQARPVNPLDHLAGT